MDFKKTFVVIIVFVCGLGASAQSESSKWAVQFGGSFIKFSENNTAFKDEDYNFQIPNVSLTRYLTKGFSIGGGLTATGVSKIDGFFENDFNILSFDGYVRYDFNRSNEILVPYVMGGASLLVKEWTDKSISGNLGVGITYWVFPQVGINTQVLYKYVPVKFKAIFPPHTQFSGGLVFVFGQRSGRKGYRKLGSGFCNY